LTKSNDHQISKPLYLLGLPISEQIIIK